MREGIHVQQSSLPNGTDCTKEDKFPCGKLLKVVLRPSV
jgi:hypothetical protein